MFADTTVIESDGCAALNGYVGIPLLSPDGVLPISTAATNTDAYQNQVCGGWFGIDETVTPAPLVCKLKFLRQCILGSDLRESHERLETDLRHS